MRQILEKKKEFGKSRKWNNNNNHKIQENNSKNLAKGPEKCHTLPTASVVPYRSRFFYYSQSSFSLPLFCSLHRSVDWMGAPFCTDSVAIFFCFWCVFSRFHCNEWTIFSVCCVCVLQPRVSDCRLRGMVFCRYPRSSLCYVSLTGWLFFLCCPILIVIVYVVRLFFFIHLLFVLVNAKNVSFDELSRGTFALHNFFDSLFSTNCSWLLLRSLCSVNVFLPIFFVRCCCFLFRLPFTLYLRFVFISVIRFSKYNYTVDGRKFSREWVFGRQLDHRAMCLCSAVSMLVLLLLLSFVRFGFLCK